MEHLQHYALADLWHPWVFAWTLLCQVAYLLAVGPLREGFRWGEAATARQKIYFSLGLWTVYLSEGTPLHVLSETFLFSAHMVQHILLTIVMPVLILVGTPRWMFSPIVRWRPTYWLLRVLCHPLVALLLFNLIYSFWHMPIAYEAVLYFHWFHMVQHAILVFTAFTMWMPLLSPVPELPRLAPLMQMLYIFLMAVAEMAVFGMITFAESPVYEFYERAPRVIPFITPEYDQQLAGIIMKLGGMGVFIAAWIVIFFKWASRENGLWSNGADVAKPAPSRS